MRSLQRITKLIKYFTAVAQMARKVIFALKNEFANVNDYHLQNICGLQVDSKR